MRLLDQAPQNRPQGGDCSANANGLAREIHDTLAQGFTSIVMNLEAAEGALPEEIPEEDRAWRHVDQARLTARESLTEARRLVWALRPESLDNASLPEALAQPRGPLVGLRRGRSVRQRNRNPAPHTRRSRSHCGAGRPGGPGKRPSSTPRALPAWW